MKSFRGDAMKNVRREMAKRNEKAGVVVEGNVKRLAPVDTGRLRASYTHDSDENGAIVGTNVEYAVYQELGTRDQEGTPHLVPGLVNSIPKLREVYGEEA